MFVRAFTGELVKLATESRKPSVARHALLGGAAGGLLGREAGQAAIAAEIAREAKRGHGLMFVPAEEMLEHLKKGRSTGGRLGLMAGLLAGTGIGAARRLLHRDKPTART
jgi:hypothetical protein